MRLIGLVVILALSLALAPLAVGAQQPGNITRIGYLAGDLAGSPQLPEALRQGLSDLGYVVGRTLVIETRDAEGKRDRLPALAVELVALKVDVILAASTLEALAAKRATRTLPVVFASRGDPVTSELVAALARPGFVAPTLAARKGASCRKWSLQGQD